MAEPSPAVQAARDDLIAALVRAGELCIDLLEGSTPEKLAATDQALNDAQFQGIVLNEVLREEGDDA